MDTKWGEIIYLVFREFHEIFTTNLKFIYLFLEQQKFREIAPMMGYN